MLNISMKLRKLPVQLFLLFIRSWRFIFLMGIMVGCFSSAMNSLFSPSYQPSPSLPQLESKEDKAIRLAAAGADMLKKSMRDPDSFYLESAFIIAATGTVCYEYRARNGFGGMNRESAVITGDMKKFKTSADDNFSAFWNRECANKSGMEAAAAIRWMVL